MGSALLVVSFGTSVAQTTDATIGAVERSLAEAFPERELVSAWTSKMICAKVERETGVHHMQLAEALETLACKGVRDVLVQPTHMMRGRENRLMLETLQAYAPRFEVLRVGDTLLASADDRARMAQVVCTSFPNMGEGDMLLLMGHGSAKGGNEVFGQMQEAFASLGRDDVLVGTVEGSPSIDDVLVLVDARAPQRVWLAPFMIVAGDHAMHDMAGDGPDSWESKLRARGYATMPVLRGLGEYEQVRALFVEHARQAKVVEPA